jgi:hypothetical protein
MFPPCGPLLPWKLGEREEGDVELINLIEIATTLNELG